MPLQNRVDPFGLIHAVSERGTMMGNRGGCFHTEEKALKSTHWKTRQWITCVLEFKGRQRELMAERQYTELFFLDEVTALAAGHRFAQAYFGIVPRRLISAMPSPAKFSPS